MSDILERLRDLSPGYGNVIKDAVEEIERLRMPEHRWRIDFENAPSPCLGWCMPPSGDEVRQIWRHPREKNQWTAHSLTQVVRAWQPLPTIQRF